MCIYVFVFIFYIYVNVNLEFDPNFSIIFFFLNSMAPPEERWGRASQRLSGERGGHGGGRAANSDEVAPAAQNPAPVLNLAQNPASAGERAAAALVAARVGVEAATRFEADGNLRALLAAANANVASL